jgi:hypothetical protein
MKLAIAITAASLAILSLPAAAQYGYDHDSTARIDQRQENQERRIERGIQTGQLSRREAARLHQGQRHIQRLEDRALADGRIDRRDRREIEEAHDRQAALINRERHDGQGRRY